MWNTRQLAMWPRPRMILSQYLHAFADSHAFLARHCFDSDIILSRLVTLELLLPPACDGDTLHIFTDGCTRCLALLDKSTTSERLSLHTATQLCASLLLTRLVILMSCIPRWHVRLAMVRVMAGANSPRPHTKSTVSWPRDMGIDTRHQA